MFIRSLIINIIIVFCCCEKNEKIYIFKKIEFSRVRAGPGPGDPSPLKTGLGVHFLPPICLETGAEMVHGSGRNKYP